MPQEHIGEEEARAGHVGDGLLPMLVASLALVVLGFVLVAAGVFG